MQQQTGRVWRAAALALVDSAQLVCLGQTETVAVTPSADAFVRSLAPASNYGAAGSLSVSGSAAVNGSGQQNGLFDSLMRFPMSDLVTSFEGSFGTNGWVVTGATLAVTEVGAPNNGIFNRGVGAFEVRWIASDTWVEGRGKPTGPTTDGVAYQDLGGVLNPAADVSLGTFTNGGVDGVLSFPLPLAGAMVSNIVAGGDLNLYLTAASASVGFTVNSRNFGTTSAWPALQVTAVAKPVAAISSIGMVGTNQVAIRFNTASNWVYVVEGVSSLASGGWSNVFTVPAKPFDDQAEFVDTMTNGWRFYRLMLSR
ncbi:MAG TPA: hypothetical protein VMD08_14210 [Candidatus Baltobacteraceae bacterium]|nr:hypothetical protein [Candidatus Baltobacteraceae bacterium]